MKKIKFYIFIFLCSLNVTLGQIKKPRLKKEVVKIDTVNFYFQDKFQNFVTSFIKDKIYLPNEENQNQENFLNNKLQAVEFAKFIIELKLGKKYPKYPKKIFVSEDKDKNLWFINCDYLNAALGGNVYIIIVKKNCKILFYFETY